MAGVFEHKRKQTSNRARAGGFLTRMPDPETLPPWLSAADVDFYVRQFEHSGFRGGLNWYRNVDRNWALTAPWQDAKIVQPSLFIAGSRDGVIAGPIGEARLKEMDGLLSDLRGKVILDGAGHWIQQERADEVNDALLAFLAGL